jgi:hypothetical protein
MAQPNKPTAPKVVLKAGKHSVIAVPAGVTPYTVPNTEGDEWQGERVIFPTDRHGFIYLNSGADVSMAMRSVTARALGKALIDAAEYMDGMKI